MINTLEYKTLEIAITDFCNLDCYFCSQGTPSQRNKMTMSLDEIEGISRYIKPYEFYTVKISGGEPTMHPHFGEICLNLKKWFLAHNYCLATNGFKLEKFIDCIGVFDEISLSCYPGKNDKEFKHLLELKLKNIEAVVKRDHLEMDDVYKESNLGKANVYKHCLYSRIKKIVDRRIYPCCVIFGQSIRKGMDIDKISVYIDENWRQNLARVNIENYCKTCFVDVDAHNSFKNFIRFIHTGFA